MKINVELNLMEWHINLIEHLINIFGESRSEVIENIVKRFFFNDSEFIRGLESIKRFSETNVKKDYQNIEIKIKNLLEISDIIDLEFFIDYLDIEKEYLYNNLIKWAKKFNFKINNLNQIIQNRE